MKEKDSQGISLWSLLAVLFMLILFAGIVVAVYFAFQRCWSDNTVSNAPQPLEVAILILTLLVTFIGIVMGAVTIWTRRDWETFRKEQEPIIKKLQKDQDEIMWITKLKDKVQSDPYLRRDESQEVVESITHHYNKDQDDEAWEMYGVGRFFDRESKYDKAIGYYVKALNSTDEVLKLHIYQSLGIDCFLSGKQLEEAGKTTDAIEAYKRAIDNYDLAIGRNPNFQEAHNNKGITLIQLGKIEGNKHECYNEAISCLDKAIEIKDNYDHHYDKARALALLNQPDKAIESLRRSFMLAKLDNLGNLLYHLAVDGEDFKNVEKKVEFKSLVKLYTDINKGDNKP